MRVSWSASGSPSDVIEVVARAAKEARGLYPASGPVLVSARDQVIAAAQTYADDAVLTMSAVIELTVALAPVDAPEPASASEDVADDEPIDEPVDVPNVRAALRRRVIE